MVGARKDGCCSYSGQPAGHVHGRQVAAGAPELGVGHHVRDDTGVRRTSGVREELDPQVADEQLGVAVGGNHDPKADEVEDGAGEDDRAAPSPRRVQVVG